MRSLNANMDEMNRFAQDPDSGPVVMINMLRFKEQTSDGESGEAAYARYMKEAAVFIEIVGGRLLWSGQADQWIVGGPEDRWDKVMLVEYPSRKAFTSMLEISEFQEALKIRSAALEETVLIASTTQASAIAD